MIANETANYENLFVIIASLTPTLEQTQSFAGIWHKNKPSRGFELQDQAVPREQLRRALQPHRRKAASERFANHFEG
jgi:hypothetical protein